MRRFTLAFAAVTATMALAAPSSHAFTQTGPGGPVKGCPTPSAPPTTVSTSSSSVSGLLSLICGATAENGPLNQLVQIQILQSNLGGGNPFAGLLLLNLGAK
jgi:hypothetical protein